MRYIVECSFCRQAFEVDAPLPPVAVPEPPEAYLTIPAVVTRLPNHGRNGQPGIDCLGVGTQGIGMGRKEIYRGDGAPLIKLN